MDQGTEEVEDNSHILHENHLLHICSALGGKEGDVYVPGDEAKGKPGITLGWADH